MISVIRKEILKNYFASIKKSSHPNTTNNNITKSSFLKYRNQNNLFPLQSPLNLKVESNQNGLFKNKMRLQSAKPSHYVLNIKNKRRIIKANSSKNFHNNKKKKGNICKKSTTSINIESKKNFHTPNENNKTKTLFFTGIKNISKNKKIKLRIKSSIKKDTYSQREIEIHKKLNLFEIYKRSNFYNKVIMGNYKKKKCLNYYIKNGNIDIYKRNFRSNNFNINNNNENDTIYKIIKTSDNKRSIGLLTNNLNTTDGKKIYKTLIINNYTFKKNKKSNHKYISPKYKSNNI